MSDRIKVTTGQSFQSDVVEATVPVLVDFHADWCGPCRMLAPVVAQLADDYAGRLAVRKVDIDANPDLASRYGVRSIPTLMVFAGGKPTETVLGLVNKATLARTVDRYVG